MHNKVTKQRRHTMSETLPPARIDENARHLIDLAAKAEGVSLSTFVRHSAVEAARKRLLGEGQ